MSMLPKDARNHVVDTLWDRASPNRLRGHEEVGSTAKEGLTPPAAGLTEGRMDREYKNARQREWVERHKEQHRAACKRWRESHREQDQKAVDRPFLVDKNWCSESGRYRWIGTTAENFKAVFGFVPETGTKMFCELRVVKR